MNYKFMLCILVRILISLLVKHFQNNKIISMLTLIQSLSFFILFLFDLRLNAPEANGITWWNSLRPIHGVSYLLFTIYYYKNYDFAWYFLLTDAILGIIFFNFRHQIRYLN